MRRCGALRELLLIRRVSRLTVLTEVIATSAASCRLDGKDKDGVVGTVEELHESLCMTFHF